MQLFFCEISEISNRAFFTEQVWWLLLKVLSLTFERALNTLQSSLCVKSVQIRSFLTE